MQAQLCSINHYMIFLFNVVLHSYMHTQHIELYFKHVLVAFFFFFLLDHFDQLSIDQKIHRDFLFLYRLLINLQSIKTSHNSRLSQNQLKFWILILNLLIFHGQISLFLSLSLSHSCGLTPFSLFPKSIKLDSKFPIFLYHPHGTSCTVPKLFFSFGRLQPPLIFNFFLKIISIYIQGIHIGNTNLLYHLLSFTFCSTNHNLLCAFFFSFYFKLWLFYKEIQINI